MAFAGGGLCAFLGQMGAGNGGQARFCSPQTIGRAAQCVPTAGDTEPCCLRAAPLRWVGLHGTDDAPRGGGERSTVPAASPLSVVRKGRARPWCIPEQVGAALG